jgi:D-amino peptidase
MKIFVMVDMEGISGIFKSSQVRRDEAHHAAARRYVTWDVNACIEGCFRGGARKVVMRDAHGVAFDFIWEDLDPRGEYIMGSTELARMPDIASYDGLILLGYHAMAGTPQAVLEHTMSSKAWQNFWMNGRKCGEIAIDAGIAGDHGVPTVMVSGDDKACREAKRFVKGVVTVQVKTGLGVEGALLLSKKKAHERIAAGAAKAVQQCRSMKPFKVKRPVRMKLELVSRGRVPVDRKHVKVIDGRTYEVVGGSVEEALCML